MSKNRNSFLSEDGVTLTVNKDTESVTIQSVRLKTIVQNSIFLFEFKDQPNGFLVFKNARASNDDESEYYWEYKELKGVEFQIFYEFLNERMQGYCVNQEQSRGLISDKLTMNRGCRFSFFQSWDDPSWDDPSWNDQIFSKQRVGNPYQIMPNNAELQPVFDSWSVSTTSKIL
jgi:hypothetical protein